MKYSVFYFIAAAMLTYTGCKQAIPALFSLSDLPANTNAATDPTIIKAITVTPNFDILETSNQFEIPLPDGQKIILKRDREIKDSLSVFWIGHSPSDPESVAHLTYSKDMMTGRIIYKRHLYRIAFAGNGIFQIARLDPKKMVDSPDDGGEATGNDEVESTRLACQDPATTIDILVLYTAAAERGAGGAAAMKSLIAQSVNLTNLAYEMSKVNHRIKVVKSELVTYAESGNFRTDVTALQDPSDHVMDEVHVTRELVKADVVILIEEKGPSDSNGMIFPVIPVNASQAFAVVRRSAAADNLSFAHELGHLLGARHMNDSGITPYPYCHGHQDGTYRDIMATDVSNIRVTNFSNPNVNFPSGKVSGVPGFSEVYRVFNNRAVIVAHFRCAKL